MSEQPTNEPRAPISTSLSPTMEHQSPSDCVTDVCTLGTLGSLPTAPQVTCLLRAGRYHITGELGRGGMGEVLRAFDPELKRPLAVKVMLGQHQENAAAERRFLEEAQVTGQLQHPGVPPVHEVGRLEDGRPFLAMKLIEGRTLEQLLRERPSPADDLPRFVALFGHICQTLAYAHSRGVIHRDLKPANVIVGAFGEVQVMDWGLAKVLTAAAADTAPTTSSIRTVRSDDPTEMSQAGNVMGTPAYMAPEQARGEIERLDERCDVFGLGALLCVLLTGAPPFRGLNVSSILQRAAAGDLEDALARLGACAAEVELVELARRCLAAEREQRPRHGGEVAAAVEAYSAGVQERLKRAELERARAEVKRAEERKRRRLTLALAAAVVAVVGLGGVSAWWMERKQAELERQQAEQRTEHMRREEQVRHAIQTDLLQATALRQRSLWREAEKVLKRAATLAAEQGLDELRERVEQAGVNLRFVEQLNRIREDKALLVEGKMNTAAAPAAYERAFREHGLDVLRDDLDKVARRITGSPIKEELIAALDDWAVEGSKRGRLWRLTTKILPQAGWRKQLADPTVWQSGQRLKQVLSGLDLHRASPQVLATLGVFRAAFLGKQGLELMEEMSLRYPADFWLHMNIATALQSEGHWDRMAEHYRAALAARPWSVSALCNLGRSLREKKDVNGAVVAWRKAIELDPHLALARFGLGLALHDRKDLDGAIASFRIALELDPKFAKACTALGNALHDKKDLDGAIVAFRRAIELDSRNVVATFNLGNALRQKKDLDGAIMAYRRVIRIEPLNAGAYHNLGIVLHAKGDLDGAIASYRKAININPRHSLPYSSLGVALHAKGDQKGAIAACQKAINIDPRNAQAHYNLGVALSEQMDLDGAIVAYHRALEIDPRNAGYHTSLALSLFRKNDLEGTISACRQALTVDPRYGNAHAVLGAVFLQHGQFAAARAASRQALAIFTANDPLRPLSARTFRAAERLLAAEGKLTAIEKGTPLPSDGSELLTLAQLCVQYKHRHTAATRFYAAAFDADPKLAAVTLGHRLAAAKAAVLAGSGKGTDAAGLDAKDHARLHQQALGWLRGYLDALTKQAENKAAHLDVRKALSSWQTAPTFAGVRDSAALAKLPATERAAWVKFWADVSALLQKTTPSPQGDCQK